MQTLALVWLAGGLVCVLAYLVGIRLAFREHARTAGVVFEVFHFGTRAILVFVLWPVVPALLVCVWWEERGRAEPGAAPDARPKRPAGR